MEPYPGVQIQNLDTLLLGTTDFDGNFSIVLTEKAEGLIISYIGLEWLTITLPENCDYLEVIVFEDGTYDFMSERKIDRIREKRFNKLPELHLKAYNKGFFLNEKPCFQREFEPYRERYR